MLLYTSDPNLVILAWMGDDKFMIAIHISQLSWQSASLWPNWLIRILITATITFTIFQLWAHKPWMKYVLGMLLAKTMPQWIKIIFFYFKQIANPRDKNSSSSMFTWPSSELNSQVAMFMGPVGPRWAPCWPHKPCYQGLFTEYQCS